MVVDKKEKFLQSGGRGVLLNLFSTDLVIGEEFEAPPLSIRRKRDRGPRFQRDSRKRSQPIHQYARDS